MERKEELSLGVALGGEEEGGGKGRRAQVPASARWRDPASALRGGERRAERGRSAKGSRGTCDPKSHGCCSLAGSRPVVA